MIHLLLYICFDSFGKSLNPEGGGVKKDDKISISGSTRKLLSLLPNLANGSLNYLPGNEAISIMCRNILHTDASYDAEDLAIRTTICEIIPIAVAHAKAQGIWAPKIAIYSDCYSVLSEIQNGDPSFCNLIGELGTGGCEKGAPRLLWAYTPSHVGVYGNECADAAACAGSEAGLVVRQVQRAPLKRAIQSLKKSEKEKWMQQTLWSNPNSDSLNHYRQVWGCDYLRHKCGYSWRALVEARFRLHHSRRIDNSVAQLRTGNATMLATCKANAGTPCCQLCCADSDETVHHFLHSCDAWESERATCPIPKNFATEPKLIEKFLRATKLRGMRYVMPREDIIEVSCIK